MYLCLLHSQSSFLMSQSLLPQVRIRLSIVRWLGGRQPHHTGGLPPVLFLPHQGAARTAVLSAVTALNSSGVRLIPNPALPLPPNASLPSQEQARPWCSHPARQTPHGPWAPCETFHLLQTHLFLRGFSSFQVTALHEVQTSRFLFLFSS